jgi:UDP-N-acetyl-D-glucosamine dehydrogenase
VRASVDTISLERKLRSRSARIAVVGLGYAGLPMAVEFAQAGFSVLGLEIDTAKLASITAGLSPVSNVPSAAIRAIRDTARFDVTADAAALKECDVIVICVPTPLSARGEPDLRFVRAAAESIGDHMPRGCLVILQSTCGPGTTRNQLLPVLEQHSQLAATKDFLVAFAPERIDPGNVQFTVRNTPKLVGGLDENATNIATLLYQTFIQEVVPVASPEIAELAKLVENTFRFINIGFINEMALLCDKLGVNVWEVVDAASTKPFAFMPHYPSPGVGGHCIPVVPHYLAAAATEVGLSSHLISAAQQVNEAMPLLIVDKVEQGLKERGKALLGASVLAIGVTYKADVADVRESAAIRVIDGLIKRGALVNYHDPLIASVQVGEAPMDSVPLDAAVVATYDAVLLLTPHSTIDYERVVESAQLVIDTHSGMQPRTAVNVVNVWRPMHPVKTPVLA